MTEPQNSSLDPAPGLGEAPAERTRFAEPPAVPAADSLEVPPAELPAEPPAEPPVESPAADAEDDAGPGPLDDDPAEAELAADLEALLAAEAADGPAPSEADSDADSATDPAGPLPAVPGSGRGVLLAALSALVMVLAGLTGYLGWQVRETAASDPLASTRSQALASAREAARLVFSYDYRTLDKDFAAGKSVTAGDFAAEYARTTSKLVEDVAPRYKAVVSADVSEAAVVRASRDQVVCLVFVNQTSTSSLMKTPKITQSRLEMTLTRKDGRWLVAKIDAL